MISTGGGIVGREANWAEMKRLGTTIYLELPLDELNERLLLSRKFRVSSRAHGTRFLLYLFRFEASTLGANSGRQGTGGPRARRPVTVAIRRAVPMARPTLRFGR